MFALKHISVNTSIRLLRRMIKMAKNRPFNRAISGALFATGGFALLVAHAAAITGSDAYILTPFLIGVSAIAAAFAIWDD